MSRRLRSHFNASEEASYAEWTESLRHEPDVRFSFAEGLVECAEGLRLLRERKEACLAMLRALPLDSDAKDSFVILDDNFARLSEPFEARRKRLVGFLRATSPSGSPFAERKAAALSVPVRDLYPFEGRRTNGERFLARCPFHSERTASFVVFPDNHYHCFGCGVNGDSISFLMAVRGVGFKEAVAELCG